ncbi:MAG: NAD(P)H:quinone oxidoreductase, type IV [Clostridiales bacterium 38_11]|nr:MAG: NAD(P)H:quinone oxidoreductase, type IV [Clostridiales bacterium 38_11]HBH13538.1 NAD(P)H:quinone oxidoreductase, type IV [Clostridiales bacterium]
MEKIKLSIVYYSATGINYQLASWAKEAAEAIGADVRLVKVQELAPEAVVNSNPAWKANAEATSDIPLATSDDLDWADAILFSVPTRFGNVSSQMKQFIDIQGGLWSQGKLADKAVSAMSSAQNPHGGQEATILSLYTSMMHWGAVIVPTGFTDPSISKAGGNPYGTSVSQGPDGKMVEDVKDAVFHQTRRLLGIAGKLKA